jgi:ribosomal protein S12 methylthiotransferase
MGHQQAISAKLLRGRVGKTIEVMVDEVDEEGDAVARSHWDAPEIDGAVYLHGETAVKPGDLVKVEVEEADEYDLWARPVTQASATLRAYRKKPVSRLAR